jgi:hypothetical protein
MCSGTESALIYDSLLQYKKTEKYHQVESSAEFITRIGSMTAAILGGILAVKMLILPFYINIITGIFMFFVALTFKEPQRKKLKHSGTFSGIIKIVNYCFQHQRILGLMLFYAVIMTTGLISIWGYLIKLTQHGLPYCINGTGFALFQLSSAIGALFSHRINKYLKIRNSFRVLLVIPLTLFLQTLSNSSWLLLFSLLHAFIWGFSLPVLLKEINILVKSEIRATVLSTGSMTGRILFVLLAPLIGLLFDKLALATGFVFLGVLFLLFAYMAEKLLFLNTIST